MKFSKLSFLIIFSFLLSCSSDTNQNRSNFNGNILNLKTIGGTKNESAQKVIKTNDNGYAIFGFTQSNDNDIVDKTDESYDYWLLKFSSEEELQWSKTYGGTDDDRGRSIIATSDGGFAITGFSQSNDGDVTDNNGLYDFWLAKIDGNGIISWQKSFGFSGTDQAFSVIQTNDGGYLVNGILDVTASGGQGNARNRRHAGGDYWAIKMDANGNREWWNYFGGSNTDTSFKAIQSNDGGFLFFGASDSNDVDITNNKGVYDFWVVKTNNSGDLQWQKNYGGSEIDEAFDAIKTADGNFLVVGNTRSNDKDVSKNNGSSDIWAIKIDANGNLVWEQNYGGSSFDLANGVEQAQDGGFYIVGNTRSSDIDLTNNNGNKDVWILKINNNGQLLSQKTVGGSEIDNANSVVELNNGNIIVVGESSSNNFDIIENKGFTDALIIKMN